MVEKSFLPETDTQVFNLSRSYARLSAKDRVLERLLHLFTQPEEMERNMQAILEVSMDYFQAEAGSILLLNKGDGLLHFAAVWGPRSEGLKAFTVPVGEGIAGECMKFGRTLAISDVRRDPNVKKEISEAIAFDVRSLIAVPIIAGHKRVGVLEILNKKGDDPFAPFEVSVTEKMGRTAGTLLALGTRMQRLMRYEEESRDGV